jgi:hypothetical protein
MKSTETFQYSYSFVASLLFGFLPSLCLSACNKCNRNISRRDARVYMTATADFAIIWAYKEISANGEVRSQAEVMFFDGMSDNYK